MSESILAWHFSDGELRFDYAGVKVEAGLVLETEEKPVIGRKGFHASEKAIDALYWFSVSPSEKIIVSRVRLSGEIAKSNQINSYQERLSSQRREHLWVADAKDSIEAFGVWGYEWIFETLEKLYIPIDKRLQDIIDLRKSVYVGELSSKDLEDTIDTTIKLRAKSMETISVDMLLEMYKISHLKDELMNTFWFSQNIGNFLYFVNRYIPNQILSSLNQKTIHFAIRASEFDATINRLKNFSSLLMQDAFNPSSKSDLEHFAVYWDRAISNSDTETKLHEMLMRLAPEGYAE